MQDALIERLARAGCVAAAEEAEELVAAAAGDPVRLEAMVDRRVGGEPLAWVTGRVLFAGHPVRVDCGVYVPRWQSEALARRAVELLAPAGLAVDLCTGSGAIAVVLSAERPGARVVATDVDPTACRCAASNGVEVYRGHLADPLPAAIAGRVDLVVAVAPYVPTAALATLPRDAREHEPRRALDGGPEGTDVLGEVVRAAARLLRPGGSVLLEVGGDQDQAMAPLLAAAGFGPLRRHVDDEEDLRAVEARVTPRSGSGGLPPPEVPGRADGGAGVDDQ